MDFKSVKTTIRTKNYEASKEFYHTFLKLSIVEEYDSEKGVRGCILSLGGIDTSSFIEISEIASAHDYFQNCFQDKFNNDKIDLQIKTDDIDYWTERLSGFIKVRGPINRPWGSKYLYIRDPDGLQIIIYQEFKN